MDREETNQSWIDSNTTLMRFSKIFMGLWWMAMWKLLGFSGLGQDYYSKMRLWNICDGRYVIPIIKIV